MRRDGYCKNGFLANQNQSTFKAQFSSTVSCILIGSQDLQEIHDDNWPDLGMEYLKPTLADQTFK